MSTLKQRGGMALLLCVAVAACSTNRSDDNSSGGSGYSSTGSSANSSASADVGSGSNAGSNTASTPAGSTRQSTSYGTVQSIDPGSRQDIGVGTLGAAAAGGSMGSPGDRVYRVTVRMDDGSTQSIVLDAMPNSYKVGDRVRYSNGSLERSTQ